MRKRLFVLSHYFHPFAGVGAVRHEYFVRHLLAQGNAVTVFKADDKYYPKVVPLRSDFGQCEFVNIAPTPTQPSDQDWLVAYYEAVTLKIREEGIPTLLLFSANPYFYLPLGPKIKEQYNIPYIIDFRDTFLNSIGLYERNAHWTVKKLAWLVRLWLHDPHRKPIKQADLVLTITNAEKNVLGRHYGKKVLSKTRVIYNGYNEEVLDKLAGDTPNSLEPPPPLRIGIFGKFAYYSPADVPKLIEALNGIEGKVAVELKLIGAAESGFTELLPEVNFSIEQTGFLSYGEGMAALSACHVCILNNRSKNSHGTKIFDYIGLNKPIIAFIGPDSEIADLLQGQDNTYIVQTAEECRLAISAVLAKGTFVLGSQDMKEQYSRKVQAQKLTTLLEQFSAE